MKKLFPKIASGYPSVPAEKFTYLRQKINKRELSLIELYQMNHIEKENLDCFLGIEIENRDLKAETQKIVRHRDPIFTISSEYSMIFKVINFLRPYRSLNLSFVDVGCGEGRVLCALFAEGFNRLYGVEANPTVMENARKNINKVQMLNPFSKINLFEVDILDFDLDQGNVFYLYWPFSEATCKDFLELLRESVKRHPRPILIFIAGPIVSIMNSYITDFKYGGSLNPFEIYFNDKFRSLQK